MNKHYFSPYSIAVRILITWSLLALFGISAQLLWWKYYPYATAFVEEPISVLNKDKIVAREDGLVLDVRFSKYTDVSPTVARNIVCTNGETQSVDKPQLLGDSRPKGVGQKAETYYEIPEGLPNDTLCFFQFTNEYDVNPIRTITKTWRSEYFTIKEYYDI